MHNFAPRACSRQTLTRLRGLPAQQLMISMSIRVTPNFRLYRDGKLVHELTGINETNLRTAVEAY